MADVKIEIRANGPYRVTGPTLEHAQGLFSKLGRSTWRFVLSQSKDVWS